jgi:murein L,D-transpeptidase YafK
VQETINWSVEQNDVVLLVDKLAHNCQVLQAGIRIDEFPIELGPNWLGHKRQRGDGATPEGRYHIKKKKSGRQTVYYKALEIDYPNAEDMAQFYAAKQRGDIADRASIGGLIEVHGDGGKGANWTAGCVALRNCDMDKVFDYAKVGTPITIVGSLRGISTVPTSSPAAQYGGGNKMAP